MGLRKEQDPCWQWSSPTSKVTVSTSLKRGNLAAAQRGVLVGQDLMRAAAEVRATISQIEECNTAASIFLTTISDSDTQRLQLTRGMMHLNLGPTSRCTFVCDLSARESQNETKLAALRRGPVRDLPAAELGQYASHVQ